jgi:hypothetical protein
MSTRTRYMPPGPPVEPIRLAEPSGSVRPELTPLEAVVVREAPAFFRTDGQRQRMRCYLLAVIYADDPAYIRMLLGLNARQHRALMMTSGPQLIRRLRQRLARDGRKLSVEQRLVIERAIAIAERVPATGPRWRAFASKPSA